MPYAEALTDPELLAYKQADLCCGIPPEHLDWRWREAESLKNMSRRARNAAVKSPRIEGDYFLLRCLDYQLAPAAIQADLYPDYVGAVSIRRTPLLRQRAEAVLLAYNGLRNPDLMSEFSREVVSGLNVIHLTCYQRVFFDLYRYRRMNGVVLQMLGGDLFDPGATSDQLQPFHQIAGHLGMAGVKAWLGQPLTADDIAELKTAMSDTMERSSFAKLVNLGQSRTTVHADTDSK